MRNIHETQAAYLEAKAVMEKALEAHVQSIVDNAKKYLHHTATDEMIALLRENAEYREHICNEILKAQDDFCRDCDEEKPLRAEDGLCEECYAENQAGRIEHLAEMNRDNI